MLVATLLCATLAAAQPSFLGQPFPLTNTRYDQIWTSQTRLASDGRDFYVFWTSDGNARMTRVTAGERRAGKPVVSEASGIEDVVWTGAHFLVVVRDLEGRLAGQLVTAAGERIAGAFPIAAGATGARVAANGSRIVVLYTKYDTHDALWVATLTTMGTLLETRPLLPRTTAESLSLRHAIASNGDGFAAVVLRSDSDRLITFGGEGEVRSMQTFGAGGKAAAIASDGTGYLVVSTAGGSNNATRVGADGTMHETATLDESGTVTSLVHTDDRWSASFHRDGHTHVAGLDPSGLSMAAAEAVALETAPGNVPQLASSKRRAMLLWNTPRSGHHVAELPLEPGEGSPVLFGAAGQYLIATAAGPRSTLFVWVEPVKRGYTLYAGTLGGDGVWREEILAAPAAGFFDVHAASDGDGFAVIYIGVGMASRVVQRLDAEGRPLAPPVPIRTPDYSPESMIWDGQRHVVVSIGTSFSGPYAYDYASISTMDGNGVSRTAAEIYPEYGGSLAMARIAGNGRNYLVVTSIRASAATYVIEKVMLGPDLRPLARPAQVSRHASGHADVAWDGTNFVIVYPEANVVVAPVPPDGQFRLPRAIYARDPAGVRVAAVAGGVAVTWRDPATHYVATLRQGTTDVVRQQAVLEYYGDTISRVVALPGSRAAVVANVPAEAAPHHGAQRLHAAVVDLAPLHPLTTAPRVTVTPQRNNRLQIDWTALAERVTGYRVEYRIGDGNWNELDRAPDPANRIATFPITRRGIVYAFRVRAMNEAGMGPYSAPAEVRLGTKIRRRTVR